MSYSGNFRIITGNEITHSMIGSRYTEDGKPLVGVVFDVNTVDKLSIYVTNSCVLLPANWQSWSQTNLPPTGLLCVHTEDYGLGEADNVLAEAERLRKRVLDEMRGNANAQVVTEIASDPQPTQVQATNAEPVETEKQRNKRLRRGERG